MSRWEDDKARVAKGYQDEFDIEDFELRKYAFEHPGLAVKKKKKKKKKKS